uniref:Uncharacterized protein n=1 Tax=Anguilla anguilla TaxID=7936 RepID=A0A0E9RLN5_ANGAN
MQQLIGCPHRRGQRQAPPSTAGQKGYLVLLLDGHIAENTRKNITELNTSIGTNKITINIVKCIANKSLYISNRDFFKKTCSLEIGAQKDWIKSFER